jgi:hypothetical protein
MAARGLETKVTLPGLERSNLGLEDFNDGELFWWRYKNGPLQVYKRVTRILGVEVGAIQVDGIGYLREHTAFTEEEYIRLPKGTVITITVL